jgi:hypothetical protein
MITMGIGFLTRLFYSGVHPIDTDWEPWENAWTLADLGEVTARWLEGRVDAHPNGHDVPDPETTELVPVLAAANRAGFVTDGSQPGETSATGPYGSWQQRAAVTGFCDAVTFFALADLAHAAGLEVRVRAMPPRRRIRLPFSQLRREPGIPVSRSTGYGVMTDFGTPMFWEDICTSFWVCSDGALEQLAEAWQVTLVDPCWGRNDRLWSVLARFASLTGLYEDRNGSRGCWTCGCIDGWNVYDCGCDNTGCRCSGPSPLHDGPDSPLIRCRDLQPGVAIYSHANESGEPDGLEMDVTHVTAPDRDGIRTITGITEAGEISFRWAVDNNLERVTQAGQDLAALVVMEERERLNGQG